MASEAFLSTLKKSLEEDKVSIEQIDNAVRLILDTNMTWDCFKTINIVMKTEQKNQKCSKDHRGDQKNCFSIFGSAKDENNCFLLKKRNYRSYGSFG
jgi:beta-glucosidase